MVFVIKGLKFMNLRIWGLELRVCGLGFEVCGLGLQGLRFDVLCLGFKI
jgi:hypothetical protein